MAESAYELLAMLMRYVFVLIGALIVWRSFRWMNRDARAYRREMRSLPDAGLVGEMVNLETGEGQPLPREGTIGTAWDADIRVKDRQALRTHARFEFEEGKGLKVIPARRAYMLLRGQEMRAPGYALHGTPLQIGNTVLRVRLFAGLKVPSPVEYPEPDALLGGESYTEPWEGDLQQSEQAQGFPDLPAQEEEYVPYETGAIPLSAPVDAYPESPAGDPAQYEGNYTEDGQMTWQYAYSLQELQNAMRERDDHAADGGESVPYQSPLQGRRRRRSRHETEK